MAFSFNTKTQLCLDKWSELMGINPLAFNNLSVVNCIEDFVDSCQTWSQDAFQNELNLEQLATYIASAENQIESFLGVHVAPTYTYNEVIEIPFFYRREEGKLFPNQMKFQTTWKNVLGFGQNKRTFLGEGTIVYTDEDGDGFKEIATITLQTDVTINELCGLEVNLCPQANCNTFCPIRDIDYNELEGIITIRSDTWLFIKPELRRTGFKFNPKSLDACNLSNFLDCVSIYYNSKDKCKPDGTIVWKKENNCESGNCEDFELPFCARLLDDCRGIFQVEIMEFTEDGCIQKLSSRCKLPCNYPDYLKVSYTSGCSDKHLYNFSQEACKTCGICKKLENLVAILAATMLPINYCNCSCLNGKLQEYQTDTAMKSQGAVSYSLPFAVQANPLGTKLGQIYVYRELLQILDYNLCN